MEAKVELLQASAGLNTVEWDEDAYNYLAIGNSITKHGINEYWWNEIGMAATAAEKDYVHQIAARLAEIVEQQVNLHPFNFSVWELFATDRYQTLQLLDPFMDEQVDFVTVQLGENIQNTSTIESDFEELISYIRQKCPNAQILIIGMFWPNQEIDDAKRLACEKSDAVFVDLSELHGDDSYYAGMGTVVYDPEGNEHIIEHEGVALHPGDKGMEKIAQIVIENLS